MATAPLTPEPAGSSLLELDDVAPDDDQEAVARKIRGLMGERRVSQQRLAAATGLSSRGMSERLAGKTNFTIRELYRIARAFRVRVTELFPDEQRGLFDASRFFRDIYNEAVLDVTRTNRPPAIQLELPFSELDAWGTEMSTGREDTGGPHVVEKEAA